jgi:hypothetical protein
MCAALFGLIRGVLDDGFLRAAAGARAGRPARPEPREQERGPLEEKL